MPLSFALLFAFLSTLMALFILHPAAYRVALIDRPRTGAKRKTGIPLIGGLGIFTGAMLAMWVAVPLNFEVRLFMVAAAMVVFLGVLDDKYELSVRSRIFGQLVAASVIIFIGEQYITGLGDLLGFGEVHLAALGIIFTYLAILASMNAYNMIDGVDGLLGSQALVTFTAITILAAWQGEPLVVAVASLMVAAIVPFLLFNLRIISVCRRAFMGDAGSMLIGLTIVWLFIMLVGGGAEQSALMNPVTALWLVAVPIMDMVNIMVRRAVNGRSPTDSDYDHIHHLLLRNEFAGWQVVLVLFSAAVGMASLGLAGEWWQVPEWLMLFAYLVIFAHYYAFTGWLLKRGKTSFPSHEC